MNLSDVVKSEELSEPDFTHHANSIAISTSRIFFQSFPVFLDG